MKIQDGLFLLILLLLLIWKRNPRYFVIAGLICMTLSIPFFYKWIFFTAERLTWYAGAYILCALILLLFKKEKKALR
jgi:hypothetical protein